MNLPDEESNKEDIKDQSSPSHICRHSKELEWMDGNIKVLKIKHTNICTKDLSETSHLHDNAVTHGTENWVGEVNYALPLRREGNHCEEQGYSYRKGEGVRGTW